MQRNTGVKCPSVSQVQIPGLNMDAPPRRIKPKVSTASTLREESSNSMMDEELDCESMATAAFSGALADSPAGPAPRDSATSADKVPANTAGAERQLEPPL